MGPSIAEYLVGAGYALVTLGASLAAGWLLITRQAATAPRGVALFVATTAIVVMAHLLPGLLFVLRRETVMAVALAAAAAAAWVPIRDAGALPARPTAPREPAWAWPVACATAAMAGTGALALVLERWSSPVHGIDALTNYLPTVARWIQDEHLWQLVQYAPDLSNSTYPHHGTLVQLAAVLPWRSTFAVGFVNVPFLVALAVGVRALARELGAGRSGSLIAAAAVTALPAVNASAFDQTGVDTPMLAWFTIGALLLLRAARGADRAELVLGGVSLGLAFGTKWYAVAYVPLVVLGFGLATRRWRSTALLAVLVVVVGGVWLVRNLVLTGNPVHPAEVGVGGLTIFPAPPDPLREIAGFTVADYLFEPEVWRHHLVPQYWASVGLLGPVLAGAALVGLLLAVRSRAWARAWIAGLSVVGMVIYTRLPDTAFGLPGDPQLVAANARYVVPALVGAAVTAGWMGPVALSLLAAGSLVGLVLSYSEVAAGHLAAATTLAGVAWVAWLQRGRLTLPARWATCVATLLLLGGVLAWTTRSPGFQSYKDLEPVVAHVHRLPEGSRVALAGIWDHDGISPVLPAFGPRLRNRVDYVGRFVEGTLRQWDGPAPFRSHLIAGRYDLVLLGKATPATGVRPRVSWAVDAGYRLVAETSRFFVLEPVEPA